MRLQQDAAFLRRERPVMDAGRAYREAGQAPEAARAYRTILEKYADSPAFTEAQVRLAELTGGKM